MKLATWNINGIKARGDRLLAWLAANQPDVMCLQEIKTEEAGFPVEPFRAAGYHVSLWGQKAYNGVALLSKTPMTDVARGFGDGLDEAQSRFLSATIGDLRVATVYVPNGESVGSDKYVYKLAWMARLETWARQHAGPSNRLAICGDYNVAPEPIDVHDPIAWQNSVLFSVPERQALARIVEQNLVDVWREKNPDVVAYTWWDYRMLGFPKNRGLRIDHVLATRKVADAVVSATIDREERKGEKPSDHAPLVLEISDS